MWLAAANQTAPDVRCQSGLRLAIRDATLASCYDNATAVPTNGLESTLEMSTFTFTLIVEGPDLQANETVDALFEAGCDNALTGCCDGVQYLDFDRDASSLEEAVLSAVADIESVDGLTVVRLADAGLVSMADIAARTGRTRESVRLLVAGERGPGGFPPPVTDPRSRYRLWRATDVERWMRVHVGDAYETREDHVRVAINAGLELRHHSSHIPEDRKADLRTLVGL